MNSTYIHKIILVGDSGSGKSCLGYRITTNKFNFDEQITIGVDFCSTIINVKGQNMKFNIWDTAGQEKYNSLIRGYFKGSHGCLIVFDITNRASFDNVKKWFRDVTNIQNDPLNLDNITKNPNLVVMLVGNKLDLQNTRQVSREEGLLLAKEFNNYNKTMYFETSAKSGTNVRDMFYQLAEAIHNNSLIAEKEKEKIKEVNINNYGLQTNLINLTEKSRCC